MPSGSGLGAVLLGSAARRYVASAGPPRAENGPPPLPPCPLPAARVLSVQVLPSLGPISRRGQGPLRPSSSRAYGWPGSAGLALVAQVCLLGRVPGASHMSNHRLSRRKHVEARG